MAILPRLATAILLIFIIADITSTLTTITVEGIVFMKEPGRMNCDSVECSPNALFCRVTRTIDPENRTMYRVVRRCIDVNGVILQEAIVTEAIGNKKPMNISMERDQAITFHDVLQK